MVIVAAPPASVLIEVKSALPVTVILGVIAAFV